MSPTILLGLVKAVSVTMDEAVTRPSKPSFARHAVCSLPVRQKVPFDPRQACLLYPTLYLEILLSPSECDFVHFHTNTKMDPGKFCSLPLRSKVRTNRTRAAANYQASKEAYELRRVSREANLLVLRDRGKPPLSQFLHTPS